MSQEPAPPTDEQLYEQIIDLRLDSNSQPQYIVQGATVSLTLDFGSEPLETTDRFSLPCWDAWNAESSFARLEGKAFKVVLDDSQHKKVVLTWHGDVTSFWPRGAAEHAVSELRGVLNHHDKDGKERGRSGTILIIYNFAHTWDRS